MNNKILGVGAVALVIGAMGGYLFAFSGHHFERFDRHNDNDWYGPFGGGMHGMMSGNSDRNRDANYSDWPSGMGHMMGMMVSSEREFIEEMISHHQEAIDTAKETLARGATTPEIKQLLENIVTAQEKEIADMKTWYQNWYGTEYKANGNYQPMMRELENLSGKDIDRAFLSGMIMHHMGAIMMARSVQPYIEHSELDTLTQAIVSTQSEEIARMRTLLRNL